MSTKKFIYIQIAASIIVSAIFFFIYEKTGNVQTAASATAVVAAAITVTAFVASVFAAAAFATFAIAAVFAALILTAVAFTVFTSTTPVFIIVATVIVAAILVVATAVAVVEILKESGKRVRFRFVLAAVLLQFVMEYGIINGTQFGLSLRVTLPVAVMVFLANAFGGLFLIREIHHRRLVEEEQELVQALQTLHNPKVRQVAEERLAEVRARLAKSHK